MSMSFLEKFLGAPDPAQSEIDKANRGLSPAGEAYSSSPKFSNDDSPSGTADRWVQTWITSMQWLKQPQQQVDPYTDSANREPKANGTFAVVRELHETLGGGPDWRGDKRYRQVWEQTVSLEALKENLLRLGPDAAEAIADEPLLFLAGLAVRGAVQLGAIWAKNKGYRQANAWPLAFDLAMLTGSAGADIAGCQNAVHLAATTEDPHEAAYQLAQAQRHYAKAIAAAVTTVPRFVLGRRDFSGKKPPIDITPPRESGSAVPALASSALANQLRDLTQRSPQLTKLFDVAEMVRLLPELLRRWPQLFDWLSGAYGPWKFATDFGPFLTESNADGQGDVPLGQLQGKTRTPRDAATGAELASPPEYSEAEIEEILDWAFDMAQIGKLGEVAEASGLSVDTLRELAELRGMRLLRSVSAARQSEIQKTYLESKGLPLVEGNPQHDVRTSPKLRKVPTKAEIEAAFYLADAHPDRLVSKQLFGKPTVMGNWRKRLGIPKGKRVFYRPLSEELFPSEQKQRIAHQGHQARTFGGLTKVAEANDVSIATVYRLMEAAGLPYAHEPADLRIKQAALDDINRGEHLDDVAQTYNLPVSIVKKWSQQRYSDEEFLTMLIETMSTPAEIVIQKYNISYGTMYYTADRFEWPHPIRRWVQDKPERAFTEAKRLQILNHIQAATRFGEITQIVLNEGATIPMVYRWAKVLEVPIVLHGIDPLQKQQIKSQLHAGTKSAQNARGDKPSKHLARFATYAEVAKQSNIPVEILEAWDHNEFCDEEIWPIVDQGHRNDWDLARIYGVVVTTLWNWRGRFGLGTKSAEGRSAESLTDHELRAYIAQVNAGGFGVLTTLADENGLDALTLYQAANKLGIPLKLPPMDRAKKKAIVAELDARRNAIKGAPAYHKNKQAMYTALATQFGYGVPVIRAWAEGDITTEEGLQIVRDHGRCTAPQLASMFDMDLRTAYHLLSKYGEVVGTRVEHRSPESFTTEQLHGYIAQVNAATEFGALTAIAGENGFAPETLYRAAKELGIPVELHPVDPQKKQEIVAELHAYADASKVYSQSRQRTQREVKCAELAQKSGYHIRVIRTWANGDYTADEIIEMLTQGVGHSPGSVGRERQVSRSSIINWRIKFGFADN